MSKYPECEKLSRYSGESNRIGQFIDWLREEKAIFLARYPKVCYNQSRSGECALDMQDDGLCPDECECFEEDTMDELQPITQRMEQLLAEYFEIDLKKVEEERRAMLEELAKMNE